MSSKMQYSQYLRIESKAGGIFATSKDFVKAAHKVCNPRGKQRQHRELRHAWIRAGLEYHHQARAEYVQIQCGMIPHDYTFSASSFYR
jgi:hypothetical protein